MRIYFEYIAGDNLRQFVSDKRIPSIDQVRRWFTPIGSALSHAHKLGIVHRDIKPENIIISPDQATSTLVDFGIAFTTDDARRLTDTGYVIGTPAYMSPEQSEGKDLDGRSDLYSLGITLYETLAGHPTVRSGHTSRSCAGALACSRTGCPDATGAGSFRNRTGGNVGAQLYPPH